MVENWGRLSKLENFVCYTCMNMNKTEFKRSSCDNTLGDYDVILWSTSPLGRKSNPEIDSRSEDFPAD